MPRSARPRTSRALLLRRVRAILASGLVLGVGAASTLAAWTDQEHATATFSAATFGIEGSTNGTTFAEHSSPGSAAALNFTVAANSMIPGRTVYAAFSVRTLATSVAGNAVLSADSGNSAGLGAHLRYGVRTIAGTTCNQTTYGTGTVVVPNDSTMTTGAATGQSLSAAAGSVVTYCFAVTLPSATPNAAQGLTSTPRWVVTGQAT